MSSAGLDTVFPRAFINQLDRNGHFVEYTVLTQWSKRQHDMKRMSVSILTRSVDSSCQADIV